MENFYQTYLLNKSADETVTQNDITVVDNLPLTATDSVLLTLRGVVGTFESGGQVGIGGATVVLYDPDGTALAQTTTDSTGQSIGSFTLNFNGIPNVYYYVSASAPGYDTSTNSVSFSGSSAVLYLLLPAESSARAFYGNVVDSVTGVGIGNANVNITDGVNVNVNVTTMSDGSFLAYDSFLVGTQYTLTAGKLGYTEQTTTAVMLDSAATRVDFTLIANSENFTTLTGKVVIAGSDPTAPIANALVGLYVVREGNIPTDNLVETVFTDYYGNYTFTGLNSNNTYVVRAIKIVAAST